VTLHRLCGLFPFLISSLLIVAQSALAGTPLHRWSRGVGGFSNDVINDIVVDATGNIYVAGSITGTVDFGAGPIGSGGGSVDAFLAKYDANGTLLWARSFGSGGTERVIALAASPLGVVLVGEFDMDINFFPLGTSLIVLGGTDVFVATIDPYGLAVGAFRIGGFDNDTAGAVAVDALGQVQVTGTFRGSAGLVGETPMVSAGLEDIFVVRNTFPPVQTRFGGAGSDIPRGIDVDQSGNLILTGEFQSSIAFGGSPLVSAGGADAFLAHLGSSHAHIWSKRFGNTQADAGQAVAVDRRPDGSRYFVMTGQCDGSVDFGGGALAATSSMFLARFASDGTHRWSRIDNAVAPGTSRGQSLAIDGEGSIMVGGWFDGQVGFEGAILASAGLTDMFTARFSNLGKLLWASRAGGNGADRSNAVALSGSNVLVGGSFSGTVNFGGVPLISQGTTDAMLGKYSANSVEPAILSIADIGNDQGRKVKVRFERSALDEASSPTPITHYAALRQDKATPPVTTNGAGTLLIPGWTQVGSVDAFAEVSYGIDVPTVGDSTIASGPYLSAFMIRAVTETPSLFYDSPPDSGYSIDNLAPGIPLNFAYNAGALTWKESRDADFDYFTVYGSALDAFGSAVVIDYTVAPTLNVIASPYAHYYVTATDHSGNEGKPAKIVTPSGVGGTPKNYVLSVSNYPNPFNPSTTITYTVPSRGDVTISIFDARGALIATLQDGTLNAGAYSVEWDGLTPTGVSAGSGVYFARIEHNGSTRSKKLVLLK